MTEELRPGDVVQLRSGGPLMTVASIDEHGVTCMWFDRNKREGAIFPPEALQKEDVESEDNQ
ncbi:MAG: DUF2158 domain-containing protein [Planctomycetes bacterium]|nr:DUF2158 domain-containing protein [Planctomycetota bacterium]